MCLVNTMHITASVFISDNEGGLLQTMKMIRRIGSSRTNCSICHNMEKTMLMPQKRQVWEK